MYASVINWMASWFIHEASRQVRATAIHLIYSISYDLLRPLRIFEAFN